jgi:ornithine cyclodeaminase/alanine dehydrogenase-like protein (mu-crystallin family)
MDLLGKYKHQQMANAILTNVVGSDLSCDGKHFSGRRIYGRQNRILCDHRQQVNSAGESWNFQKKSVKLFPVICMRKLG